MHLRIPSGECKPFRCNSKRSRIGEECRRECGGGVGVRGGSRDGGLRGEGEGERAQRKGAGAACDCNVEESTRVETLCAEGSKRTLLSEV
jgi:hypothetical protein